VIGGVLRGAKCKGQRKATIEIAQTPFKAALSIDPGMLWSSVDPGSRLAISFGLRLSLVFSR
jgi:hypothetical protein